MDAYDYRVEIVKLSDVDGGGFLATVPKLPGCISDGETPDEALKNIEDAIKCWLDTAKELGREIPKADEYKSEDEFSGRLSLRIPKSLHKAISIQAEKEGCSINQLITMYVSMGVGNEFGKNQVSINVDTSFDTFQKLVNEQLNEQWKNYVVKKSLVEDNRGVKINLGNSYSDARGSYLNIY